MTAPSLLSLLASVTGDLVPADGSGLEMLGEARRETVKSVRSGQRDQFLIGNLRPQKDLSGNLKAELERLIADTVAADTLPQRVLRRDHNLPRSLNPRDPLPSTAGQAITKSLGPFMDQSKSEVALDVLTAIPLIPIQFQGASQPFLYISLTSTVGTGSSLTLGSGSIWIPASEFVSDPTLPASSFVGVSIQSGTISFGASIPLGARPIAVPATSHVLVALKPSPEVNTPTGHFSGSPSVSGPTIVEFAFTTAGGSLASASNIAVSLFGTALSLIWEPVLPRYVSQISRIEFAFRPNFNSFSITANDSQLVQFSGTAPVSFTGWSLPIVISSASSLAAASGAGGVSLWLNAGLQINLLEQNFNLACGVCVFVIEPTLLVLTCQSGQAAPSAQTIPLWSNSMITIRPQSSPMLLYLSENTGIEAWSIDVNFVASFDQPRTINNDRVRYAEPGTLALIKQPSDTKIVFSSTSSATDASLPVISYALKNFLLGASGAVGISGTASFVNGAAPQGSLIITFHLRFAAPLLPDPYTTTTTLVPTQDGPITSIGLFETSINWTAGQLTSLGLSLADLPSISSQKSISPPKMLSRAVAAAGGSLPTSNSPQLVVREGTAILLDLSTNVSQFGVTFDLGSTSTSGDEFSSVSFSDLMIQAPGTGVHVIALPAVQWEPVSTPNPIVANGTTFPSVLDFPNSGSVTDIATSSVTLVPIAPRQAIDNVLSTYNATTSSNVAATFTLPFGMEAQAQLAKSTSILFGSPGLAQVQPTFSSDSLVGGDQLSITAPRSRLILPKPGQQQISPAIPGSLTQSRTAVFQGTSTPTTVISTVGGPPLASDLATAFNTQFSTGSTAEIPVTRVDISGFGESVLSEWEDPATMTGFSKVEFNVLVGRTSLEVVQFSSVCYPFLFRLVRTITIQRLESGVVVRQDDGWRASSTGIYADPLGAIITHPGVVQGVTNVTNIRDLNQSQTVSNDTIALSGVQYDCDVLLENVIAGQSTSGAVPARNLTGYVLITPNQNNGLTAAEYSQLISQTGPLGGLVDGVINIGKSGQTMRIAQVGVGVATDTSGNPEFVMAASGTPIFPAGGEWSFIVINPGDTAPSAIGTGGAVPLIRQGASTFPIPASSPYQFADPSSLFIAAGSSQVANYGICFAMPTQRIAFFDPVIITNQTPFAITSSIPPILADPFTLATATGIFPTLNICIPFNDANYKLLISSSGNLKLQLGGSSSTTFTTPAVQRTLIQSQTATEIAYTNDDKVSPAAPCQVTIVIDTSNTTTPWSFQMTNFSLLSVVPSLAVAGSTTNTGEVSRTVGNFSGDSNTPVTYQNTRLVFGPVLQPVQKAMQFLQMFGPLAPFMISMTNKWSIIATLDIDLDGLLFALQKIAPGVEDFLKQIFQTVDFQYIKHTDALTTYSDMQFTLRIKIPIVGVWIFTIIGRFTYHVGTDGKSYLLQLGGGVGASLQFLKFNVFAAIEVTIDAVLGNNTWGVGASVIISASINFFIVTVQTSIEARQLFMMTTCTDSKGNPAETTWGLTQVLVAVDISIFWVCSIDFHYQTEWDVILNGGGCTPNLAGAINVGTPE
ncbi:MAG: hypothetical protein MMC33_000775 [Icmadophila ericetorum]|nr:hypothetical protein [Icmadophila ericetorum]